MSCPCETRQHPRPPDIPPGLPALPRAIGRFDDFRAALWGAQAGQPALAGWSGQAPGDLGAMLLDAWAVVCDIAAFYDEARANEAYIGTAPERRHLERLVATLGYRPRPATAARAWVAMELSGARPLGLPAGTALRSGPVGDGPPQVFETAAALTLEPALGALALDPAVPATLAAAQGLAAGMGASLPALWVDPASLAVDLGDAVVLQAGDTLHAARVAALREDSFGDGTRAVELRLDPPPAVDAAALPPDAVRLWTPGQTARPWTASAVAGDPAAVAPGAVVLSGPTAQIAAGDIVLLRGTAGSMAASRAATVEEVTMTLKPAATATATDADGDSFTIAGPAVTVPATRLSLSPEAPVTGTAAQVSVGHAMRPAARLAAPPPDATGLAPLAVLPLAQAWRHRRRWRDLDRRPVTALISDPAGRGAAVTAELDPRAGTLSLGADAPMQDLGRPVTAHANAVMVTRGETVAPETLGIGDATIAGQSFQLSRPLTYLPAPTEAGYTPALTVRVDGIAVPEVASFFGRGPGDLVFTLREDAEGATHVTFGDGRRGARLATGAVVTAQYRSGAGADRPGPGSLTQLVAPRDGISRVHQPFAAWGGSDREDAALLRTNAPRSALLLGRAISLEDFEAAALSQDGIDAARAGWTWSRTRQRPLVQVRFAGDGALAPALSARLRALSDPSVALEVTPATPLPVRLALQVQIAPGAPETQVLAALAEALTGPPEARFSHARPRIGAPVFRSALAAEALAVPGVAGVPAMLWTDGQPPDPGGVACPPDRWFTLDPALGGALVLNGHEFGTERIGAQEIGP
ncbi:MAG: hypothetical protein ACXIU8_13805 [Alkalilacustris sp.]